MGRAASFGEMEESILAVGCKGSSRALDTTATIKERKRKEFGRMESVNSGLMSDKSLKLTVNQ